MSLLKKFLSVCLIFALAFSIVNVATTEVSAVSENSRYYEAIPDHVYATAGEPLEIYYNNVLSIPSFTIIFDVPEGVSRSFFDDRIELTAQTSGDYTIPWRVYDSEYAFVESGEMTLVARNRNLKDMTVLVLGDSTVYAGVSTQTMLDSFKADGSVLTLLGTVGNDKNLYEGRNGWRSYEYCELEEKEDIENPFFSDGFDFTYYMNSQGYDDLDVVIIQLGINDIKKFTFEEYSAEKSLLAFDEIISSILEYDSDISIVISIPIPPNENLDVFNEYTVVSSPVEYRNNIIHFANELIGKYSGRNNIYFSPANCSIDTATEIEDAIHPTDAGYKKIGISHVETLNYILNKEVKPEPTKITTCVYKNDAVNLTWIPMKDAESYEIIRTDVGVIATTDKTSYTDFDIESGNIYDYVVRTRFIDGYVYNSRPFSITIIDEPVLKSAKNGPKGVQVSWKTVNGAESYVVYRKTDSTSWKKLGVVETNSFIDTKAVSGNSYIYTVRASLNSVLSSYNKAGVSCHYLATPALKAIANKANGVQLKWEQVEGADGYYVYRKTSKNGKWVRVAKVSGTSYGDKNVKSSGNYFYTVRAYSGDVLSGYVSSGIATKFLSVPALKKVQSSQNGVTLTYGSVSGAKGYYIYRKTGTGSWKKIATVNGGDKVSYLDKTAKKGTTYTYTVRAVNGKYISYYNTKGLTIKDKY